MSIRDRRLTPLKYVAAGIGVCVCLALVSGRLVAQEPGAGGGRGNPRNQPPAVENVLQGVIDFHAHSDPDEALRNIDAIDLALYGKLRGMRGLVLKSHGQETSGVAWLTAKMVPGIDLVAVTTLDLSHGGLNKWAIEQFATVVKKANNPSTKIGVVMFPTNTACYQSKGNFKTTDCVVVSKNGQLVPEAVEVLGVIKKYGLILSAGHISPDEHILLFKEAKKQGITQMMATHVNLDPPGLDLAHMQEASALGAYMGFAAKTQRPDGTENGLTGLPNGSNTEARNKWSAEMIRKLGPEHVIMESDLGAIRNEMTPDGMADFIINMRKAGFTKAETDMMTKSNPAKLLGLPVKN